MAYVIAEPCIDVLDVSCVSVCPVDCIHFEEGTDRKLFIDPNECIDCGACEPECPVNAIFPEESLPPEWRPQVRSAGFRLVDGRAGGVPIGEPRRVHDRVGRPLGRELVLGEDRVHRAFGLAGAAVDALVGVDEQLPIDALLVMDAVDRADGDARDVQDVDAGLGNDVGHARIVAPGPDRAMLPRNHLDTAPPRPG